MNKQEALNFIRNQMGFIPYSKIFEIYSDEDDIPQELINLECQKIEKKPFIICCSHLANKL